MRYLGISEVELHVNGTLLRMDKVVIELLNHLGLGRGAYIVSLAMYCRKLNEFTNNKFDFRPCEKTPNVITFRQGVMIHLLKVNLSAGVVNSIEIVENDHLWGDGDDGKLF